MLFTEPSFLFVFLPLLLLLYFGGPRRLQNLLLTTASLLFYSVGEWRFLPWLLGSVLLNYLLALGMDRFRGRKLARGLLITGIISDLLLLCVFKYLGFAVSNLNSLLQLLGLHALTVPAIALPLGISFFTFHKISYKVDVFHGQAAIRKNPLDLALYILLFPQLIAGPIVRYHEVAEALVARHTSLGDFTSGLSRFLVGFAKKMLLANSAALVADGIFALPPGQLSSPLAWLATLGYTLQIYFDFSGYSDMAIGLARILGFTFLENFDYPYVAASITEFWRRWHMSLSRWFRDYLYIPLGGNRGGALRTYRNLLIVFFLCGLWHGASWSFVLWGLYHGGLLIAERTAFGRFLQLLPRPLRHLYTLLAVMLGWVLFRADCMAQAALFLRTMAGLGSVDPRLVPVWQFLPPVRLLLLGCALIGTTPVVGALEQLMFRTLPAAVVLLLRWAALILLFGLSLMQVAAGTYNPFIYFRF